MRLPLPLASFLTPFLSAIRSPSSQPEFLKFRQQSTTSIGTAYEHLCLRSLRRLGFTLSHRGGRADRGIDLIGTWRPPPLVNSQSTYFREASRFRENTHRGGDFETPAVRHWSPEVKVIVQCKAHTRTKPHPQWIRELQGAVVGAPAAWRRDPHSHNLAPFTRDPAESVGAENRADQDIIGILCATAPATAGVREAVREAERGVLWIRVESVEQRIEGKDRDEGEGRVTQFLWNKEVERLVGKGFGTSWQYIGQGERGKMVQEIVMMRDGVIWESSETGEERGSEE